MCIGRYRNMPVCFEGFTAIKIVQILLEIKGKHIQVLDSTNRKGYRVGIDINFEKGSGTDYREFRGLLIKKSQVCYRLRGVLNLIDAQQCGFLMKICVF